MRPRITVLVLAVATLLADAVDAQLRFEAASIKTRVSVDISDVVPGVFLPNGQWSARGATLSMLIRSAYGLPADRIGGLPSWGLSERFDIITTTAPNRSIPERREMAQQLLADRFGLRVRWEKRTRQVHALTLANEDGALGRGLRPATSGCRERMKASGAESVSKACGELISQGAGGTMRLQLRDRPLEDLFPISGARVEIGDPIADRTGLSGRFDIDLEFAPRSWSNQGDIRLGLPLAVAVEQQLGLRFELRQELIDVLVVESATRPTMD